MLEHSERIACLEHFDLLTVNDLDHTTNPVKGRSALQMDDLQTLARNVLDAGPGLHGHKFDYEPFNCNNVNIRYWSWYYRGCWHQTCPPMDTR